MLKSILNLEGVSILSKKQQKTFLGGMMAEGTCGYHYVSWTTNWIDDMAVMVVNPVTVYGVSKDEAIAIAGANGGNWCCDSCSTASWIGLAMDQPS